LEHIWVQDPCDSVIEAAKPLAASASEGAYSKANGKTRPVDIPAMKCWAMQALQLLALEPIAETTGDPNSYGFRPERSTADAAAQCFGVMSR
jgi:retron-type reverse transcriptase